MQLINMFGQKQQGGATDEDEVIVAAFQAFADANGLINCDSFKTEMMMYAEKYTKKDMANLYEIVPIENNKFSAKYCCDMLSGKHDNDEEEEEQQEGQEAEKTRSSSPPSRLS